MNTILLSRNPGKEFSEALKLSLQKAALDESNINKLVIGEGSDVLEALLIPNSKTFADIMKKIIASKPQRSEYTLEDESLMAQFGLSLMEVAFSNGQRTIVFCQKGNSNFPENIRFALIDQSTYEKIS